MTSRFPSAALMLACVCGTAARHRTDQTGTGATAPAAFGQIDRERLLSADDQPENWLTAGRDFGKTHHSALAQIDKQNVARLGFAWEYVTRTNRGLEATPIVVDGQVLAAKSMHRSPGRRMST